MLRPSRKTLYALEAVLDIAYHAGGEPVQSRQITQRQGIPRRYLEQTLQQLVRGGILTGVRGPRGGYRLARERRRISLGEIVRLLEVEEAPADDADAPASALGQVVVRPLWDDLAEQWLAQLDTISLDDLCRQAQSQGIEPDQPPPPVDFCI
ncbi:RrF2 family transcriptional regulator [Roseospirillum parvum]|uniref:Rrf2 family protein n=1 Tax=Roseospirillum parvum TaxID=83401 RepID=A0A1G8FYQ7_9PROT|nr:Rrf2 family transcriptional regulator [Roseospirillum parvum]SDH87258.1 Rrf2 family protein [Roseospirillum parvum]